jgi:hypothetical protein
MTLESEWSKQQSLFCIEGEEPRELSTLCVGLSTFKPSPGVKLLWEGSGCRNPVISWPGLRPVNPGSQQTTRGREAALAVKLDCMVKQSADHGLRVLVCSVIAGRGACSRPQRSGHWPLCPQQPVLSIP